MMSTLEAARIIQEPVFGPYSSRRFGKSLGVNPLPPGSRLCNFDCIYCECGTATWPLDWELRPQFPTPEQIRDELRSAATVFGPDELDSITIAGNGEPTLAPELDAVIDVVNESRDRDWPQARTVILTNGTMCHKRDVRAALAKLDQRVVKLDAGTNWMLEQLNRPTAKLSLTELLRRISMLPEIIVQSMFVHGPVATPAVKISKRGAGGSLNWRRSVSRFIPWRGRRQKAGSAPCGAANSRPSPHTFNPS